MRPPACGVAPRGLSRLTARCRLTPSLPCASSSAPRAAALLASSPCALPRSSHRMSALLQPLECGRRTYVPAGGASTSHYLALQPHPMQAGLVNSLPSLPSNSCSRLAPATSCRQRGMPQSCSTQIRSSPKARLTRCTGMEGGVSKSALAIRAEFGLPALKSPGTKRGVNPGFSPAG